MSSACDEQGPSPANLSFFIVLNCRNDAVYSRTICAVSLGFCRLFQVLVVKEQFRDEYLMTCFLRTARI